MAPLDGVRVVKGKWTLALPRVDNGVLNRESGAGRERDREKERRRVAREYLTDEDELSARPFVVVRGERPNYWEAHLSRVRARTEGVLMIEGPPGT